MQQDEITDGSYDQIYGVMLHIVLRGQIDDKYVRIQRERGQAEYVPDELRVDPQDNGPVQDKGV